MMFILTNIKHALDYLHDVLHKINKLTPECWRLFVQTCRIMHWTQEGIVADNMIEKCIKNYNKYCICGNKHSISDLFLLMKRIMKQEYDFALI